LPRQVGGAQKKKQHQAIVGSKHTQKVTITVIPAREGKGGQQNIAINSFNEKERKTLSDHGSEANERKQGETAKKKKLRREALRSLGTFPTHEEKKAEKGPNSKKSPTEVRPPCRGGAGNCARSLSSEHIGNRDLKRELKGMQIFLGKQCERTLKKGEERKSERE